MGKSGKERQGGMIKGGKEEGKRGIGREGRKVGRREERKLRKRERKGNNGRNCRREMEEIEGWGEEREVKESEVRKRNGRERGRKKMEGRRKNRMTGEMELRE